MSESNIEVTLREITKDNWRDILRLKVAPSQGCGYGRKALELFFAYVKTRPGGDVVETSCVPAKSGPGSFYEKMGFVYTGQEENGELVMRRELRSRKGVGL